MSERRKYGFIGLLSVTSPFERYDNCLEQTNGIIKQGFGCAQPGMIYTKPLCAYFAESEFINP